MAESELEQLPSCVLDLILNRIDNYDQLSLSGASRFFRGFVRDSFVTLRQLDLREPGPPDDVLERLLNGNSVLESLSLHCRRLGNPKSNVSKRHSLRELSLSGIDKCCFTSVLICISHSCRNLRSLTLESTSPNVLPECRMNFFIKELFTKLESLSLVGEVFSPLGSFLELPDVSRLESLSMDLGQRRFPHVPFKRSLLRELKLVVHAISWEQLAPIAESCPVLEVLEMREKSPNGNNANARRRSDPDLDLLPLHAGCPRLSEITLIRCENPMGEEINDRCLMSSACAMEKRVKSIHLAGYHRITDSGCRELLQQQPCLLRLGLPEARLTDLAFRDLFTPHTPLLAIDVTYCLRIADDAVRDIGLVRGLRELKLRGCADVGDAGVMALWAMPHLETLDIGGTGISDRALLAMGATGVAPLCCLSLSGCAVTDAGIAGLLAGKPRQTLRKISLSNIPALTDGAVAAITHSGVELQELSLRGCHRMGDPSMAALGMSGSDGGAPGATLLELDMRECRNFTMDAMVWLRSPHFRRLKHIKLGFESAGPWPINPVELRDIAAHRLSLVIWWQDAEILQHRNLPVADPRFPNFDPFRPAQRL